MPFRTLKSAGAILVLAAAAFLLFCRLGHYRLWDDEAAQALMAGEVWRTGDTLAMVGPNLIAYDNGAELRHLHDRANPPLPAYLMAPFVGLGGRSAFWARFPMALCGLGYACLLLAWLRRSEADATTWVLFCLYFLGDVSFLLFTRQARYYGVILLCSLAIARLYLRRKRTRAGLVGMSLLLFCLLASHTVTYAGVVAVLACDYLLWRSKTNPLTGAEWGLLLVPQIVLGTALLSVWNPFFTRAGSDLFANTVRERLELFWWNLRSLDRNELGATLLLLAAPFLGRRDVTGGWLRRGLAAILIYCAVVAAISPKVVRYSIHAADLRYLLPLVPLTMAMSVFALRSLCGNRLWLALPLGVAAFWTNLFNPTALRARGLESTSLDYLAELVHPHLGAYGACVEWMRKNIPPGSTIWVNPGYAAYPLMFHRPEAVYAWQLRRPAEPQFKAMPPIQFYGEVPPDYFIAFGPFVDDTRRMIRTGAPLGFFYDPLTVIPQYWDDVHKPGLYRHHFSAVTRFDPNEEAIYIFKRRKAFRRKMSSRSPPVRPASSQASRRQRSDSIPTRVKSVAVGEA